MAETDQPPAEDVWETFRKTIEIVPFEPRMEPSDVFNRRFLFLEPVRPVEYRKSQFWKNP